MSPTLSNPPESGEWTARSPSLPSELLWRRRNAGNGGIWIQRLLYHDPLTLTLVQNRQDPCYPRKSSGEMTWGAPRSVFARSSSLVPCCTKSFDVRIDRRVSKTERLSTKLFPQTLAPASQPAGHVGGWESFIVGLRRPRRNHGSTGRGNRKKHAAMQTCRVHWAGTERAGSTSDLGSPARNRTVICCDAVCWKPEPCC